MQVQWLEISNTEAGRNLILLSVGDGQSFGLGEICLAPVAGPHAALHLIKACAGQLADLDLRNINVALDAVSSVTERDTSAGPPVRSAFDTALHDFNGKLRGCPVHVMLGGSYRREVAVARRFRHGDSMTSLDDRFTAVLLDYKPQQARNSSSYGQESTGRWLTTAIDRFSPKVQIDIACDSSFENPANAKTFVEGLLQGGPRQNLGLHQPLHEADLAGHGVLCASLPMPVILDTSVRSAKIMSQIVRLSAADRVVINIERVGGLREATQIQSIAEAASIGVSSATESCTAIGAAAALHFAATIHDTFQARLDNFSANFGPVVDAGFVIGDRVAGVGAAPGLGVVLHDDAVAAFQPA